MTSNLNSLPTIYLITPEPDRRDNASQFLKTLEKSLAAGIRLVQLRAKTLNIEQYIKLASDVLDLCSQHQVTLLLNSAPSILKIINAHGVHLDGTRLPKFERKYFPKDKLISVACHSTEQIARAITIEANLITLSPVLETTSHPGLAPMGWEKFAGLAKQTTIPVFALGGMELKLLTYAKEHGAYGVAGIRSFWQI